MEENQLSVQLQCHVEHVLSVTGYFAGDQNLLRCYTVPRGK